MTLLDIRNRLINLLTTQDTICPEDFSQIEIVEELAVNREGLVRKALEQLEDMQIVSQTDDDLWILNEPLNSGGQDIHISTHTANTVAMLINAYLDANGATGARADAMGLAEVDIVMILNILGDILEQDPKGQGGGGTSFGDEDGEPGYN